MDTTWLTDFVCLCRTLNFSRAAEERNVTQSAFSRRIKSLEAWVGAPLIDRSTYPVRLTAAGRQFLSTAQQTMLQLTDTRQSIRTIERGKLPFQRFAALHAISIDYLQPRLAAFESAIPQLRTRVISDTMASCCQLLAEGSCDFLLYYRHQHVEPTLDETRFVRKDLCTEELMPVAQHAAAARHGWTLSGSAGTPTPYLSYEPDSFLGTVVDRTISHRQASLDVRYMDALVESIKRRTLAGGGIAWLPAMAINDELERGELVRVGGSTWSMTLTISLFCSPDRLDPVGRELWKAF
jgi:DNA-binding transcriptional LysR family regulator